MAAPGAKKLRLSSFVTEIKQSPTSIIVGKVKDMKFRGIAVNGALCVGEPDFMPPPEAMKATAEAAEKGHIRYTQIEGTMEIRQAICEYLKNYKGLQYAPTQICVGTGGKQVIWEAVMALCEKGDEVIIPSPYWTSYPDIVKMSGATPIDLPTVLSEDYAINAQKLASAITPNTRMLIICNPSNPTGACMDKEQLEAIAEVLRKPENEHVYVLSDEIYERITYDGIEHVAFATLDGMMDRTLTINGLAKAFAMTGYRLGYIAGPQPIVAACTKLQSQITSNCSSISQYAGIAALKSDMSRVSTCVAELQKKRDRAHELLLNIDGVACPKGRGAFYLLPDISAYYGRKTSKGQVIFDSISFCEYLLDDYAVALTPGAAFGSFETLRISYAATMENIEDAIAKMGQALKALS